MLVFKQIQTQYLKQKLLDVIDKQLFVEIKRVDIQNINPFLVNLILTIKRPIFLGYVAIFLMIPTNRLRYNFGQLLGR